MPPRAPIELWGGVECTVNRVHDRYFDQLERTGHDARLADLDLIADLGVRVLRYPVIWERAAGDLTAESHVPHDYDWRWTDERLFHLRQLGIRPIAGLVHHGSGPRFTDLLDPAFPEKLARYARAVAERYPWLDAYTPVNEPVTTARFSCTYGHWYPHARDERAFARALLNQVKATVLAMRAIRAVNPTAQLVQTDDLGQTHSTAPLAYQADFENERRWLAWDLLCGLVTPTDRAQRMWQHLRSAGISESEIAWFVENPCPLDLIGINHYVTSERFLDHRLGRYPSATRGGNGRHRYADVEAARAAAPSNIQADAQAANTPLSLAGPGSLLRQAWQRYHRPLAITECHLWSTREEQLRWLLEVWRDAHSARDAGADLRAVTAWSLFGACDWNSLLTRETNHYEIGAFDARFTPPRPTKLAALIHDLAQGKEPS